ncbi:MAG: universal stress protein [Bacteroidetes bacterium]|nr:universal stress protein [Bacteroidota bacterium]
MYNLKGIILDKPDLTPANKIILVPTDFSEVCGNAVLHAAELARILNDKLVILHVVDNKAKASLRKKHAGTESIMERLDKFKTLYEKNCKISIETMMKEGTVFTAINKAAAELHARVMVIGTHGKKGWQYLTGSYILKVTDKSPVPVIIVQNGIFNGKYSKILVPMTDALHPDKKVAWAKYFSGMFNAKMHFYQYFHKDHLQESRLSAFMEKISRSFEMDEIPFFVNKAEKESRFSSQVISYAVSHRCDLIMIIDVNHAVSSAAWYESLLFNNEQIPVMTINLAKVKKPG